MIVKRCSIPTDFVPDCLRALGKRTSATLRRDKAETHADSGGLCAYTRVGVPTYAHAIVLNHEGALFVSLKCRRIGTCVRGK